MNKKMKRYYIEYEVDDEILEGFALLNDEDYDNLRAEIHGELNYVYDIELEDEKIIMSMQVISVCLFDK